MAKEEKERIQLYLYNDVLETMIKNVEKLTNGKSNRPKTNGDRIKIVVDKFNEFMMEDTK